MFIENFNDHDDQLMTFEMVKWWHLVVDLLKIGQEKKIDKIGKMKMCSDKFGNYQISSMQVLLIMVHVGHIHLHDHLHPFYPPPSTLPVY